MKVGISIEEKLHEKATEFAEETGRTFSGLVRVSLKEKLEKEAEKEFD